MTIEDAIQKAIEGGYDVPRLRANPEAEQEGVVLLIQAHVREHQPFLDAAFWQSLGKALGWDVRAQKDYLYEWHRLIDHLAEGGSAESFFETLTEEQELKR